MSRRNVIKLSERIDDLQSEMLEEIISDINFGVDFENKFDSSFSGFITRYKEGTLRIYDYQVLDYIRDTFYGEIKIYLLTVNNEFDPDDWLDVFVDACYDHMF